MSLYFSVYINIFPYIRSLFNSNHYHDTKCGKLVFLLTKDLYQSSVATVFFCEIRKKLLILEPSFATEDDINISTAMAKKTALERFKEATFKFRMGDKDFMNILYQAEKDAGIEGMATRKLKKQLKKSEK